MHLHNTVIKKIITYAFVKISKKHFFGLTLQSIFIKGNDKNLYIVQLTLALVTISF